MLTVSPSTQTERSMTAVHLKSSAGGGRGQRWEDPGVLMASHSQSSYISSCLTKVETLVRLLGGKEFAVKVWRTPQS